MGLINTTVVITANNILENKYFTMYDRVNFIKDSLLICNLKFLIKDKNYLSFDDIVKEIKEYIKNKKEKSNVDLFINESSIEICKPNKTMPTIWLVKK